MRQYGFQDSPIVDMVRPVTKHAVQVRNPADILWELERAVWIAKDGRPGPVLLDIPDDIQRADVNARELYHYEGQHYKAPVPDLAPLVKALREAKRPIFIWGAGMRRYAKQASELAHNLGIPVACTWGAIDLINHNDPLFAGGFGTHGTRAANFGVANSDLLISIGCRLDTKATARPNDFCRAGRIAMVDLDGMEIAKFEKLGRQIDFPIQTDVGDFLDEFQSASIWVKGLWQQWRDRIIEWRQRYDEPTVTWPGINPYRLMKQVAQYTTKEDIICTDTGFALGWTMQAFPFKGERFIHALNQTPMGYGLPAAVGAAFATGRRVVLFTGDGSLMMSLSELATVQRWNLPIKIILFNNQGHGMCRQTQRQWLGGTYPATSIGGGLGFPDFEATAKAFRIPDFSDIASLFSYPGPGFCEVEIHPDAHMIPQARYGQPIEDADPQLPREEFRQQMIVEPI